MTVRNAVLLAVVFLAEVAMVVLVWLIGWRWGSSTVASVLLAVGLVALVVLVWSRWLAPKAAHPLGHPWDLLVKTVLFATVAVGCAAVGLNVWGAVFFAVALGSTLLARAWRVSPRG